MDLPAVYGASWLSVYYSAPVGSGVLRSACLSVCLCMSVSISLDHRDPSSRNFLCISSVAVARSVSGGIAIRYVLPVLWMTSRSAVMGRMAMRGRLNLQPTTTSGVVIPGRSLVSKNSLFVPCKNAYMHIYLLTLMCSSGNSKTA